ncbi:MAG: DUF2189 domain-containing protein [Alphaproteobacteria bacterium]|nr:MAG: DUF2189 domain-containing protein [Alphaproteobacteria bacterium]
MEASLDGVGIRKITVADLRGVLARGLDDFNARPTHVIFLCAIYPVVAIVLARLTSGYRMLPLFFPLLSGFALIGPIAATGVYELSRRRERGQDYAWWHAFDVLRSPSIGGLVVLGVLLALIFLIWLQTALTIYNMFFPETVPASVSDFVQQVLFTEAGWGLIVVGCGVGFLFAVVVLTISVVSLPMLLDRDVGVVTAIVTSVRAVIANPLPMAAWGLIVVAGLGIGALPLFVGLAVTLPILGHATWHLYRAVVVR